MTTNENRDDNMTVKEASKIMKKSPDFIKAGLEQKSLPFGVHVKMKRNEYHISRKAFLHYMQYGNIPIKEIRYEIVDD